MVNNFKRLQGDHRSEILSKVAKGFAAFRRAERDKPSNNSSYGLQVTDSATSRPFVQCWGVGGGLSKKIEKLQNRA